MNDVAVAACFFAAVAYGLRYLRSQNTMDVVFFGTSIGLLAGVKYFAIGYAVLTAAIIAAAIGLAFGLRRALFGAAATAVIAFPFGGFWYVRNLYLAGTPLFPLGAGTYGVGYPGIWSTTFVGNGDAEILGLTARALWVMTGPIHYLSIVAVPSMAAIITVVGFAQMKSQRRVEGIVMLALCALTVGTGSVLCCTPFAIEDQPNTLNHLRWAYTPARYGLCFLSTSVLLAAWSLQASQRACLLICHHCVKTPRAVCAAVAIGVPACFLMLCLWQLVLRVCYMRDHYDSSQPPALRAAAITSAGLFVCGVVLALSWPRGNRARVVAASCFSVLLIAGFSCAVAVVSVHWHRGYAPHFDALRGSEAFSWLATRSPMRVAVLDYHPYPFFGSSRQHQVCSPYILTTYGDLIRYLEPRRPDVVASATTNTRSAFDRYKPGAEWLAAKGEQFSPVYSDSRIQLFLFSDAQPLCKGAQWPASVTANE